MIQTIYKPTEDGVELVKLLDLDQQRKDLIKFALLQAIHLKRTEAPLQAHPQAPPQTQTTPQKTPKTTAQTPAELVLKQPDLYPDSKSIHEYQIIINKLKQDATTKQKVYESKIELLRKEVERLKNQLYLNLRSSTVPLSAPASLLSAKTGGLPRPPSVGSKAILASPHGFSFSTNPGLSFSTSPYLNKTITKGYLAPTSNSLSRTGDTVPSLETLRILPALDQSKKLAGSPLTSPLAPGPPTKQPTSAASRANHTPTSQQPKTKRTYTNFNSLKRLHNPDGLTSDDIMNGRTLTQLNVPSRRKPVVMSPATPQQKPPVGSDTSVPGISDGPDSAESSVIIRPSNGKKKKLQLGKSETTKVSISTDDINRALGGEKTSPSKGLNLENEDLNTLNYYEDSNWTGDNEISPQRASTKRAISEDSGQPSKRRKNVFKID